MNNAGTLTTMGYDKENRMSLHQNGSTITTSLYSADNMKRKNVNGVVTTLIWDGSNYLGGKS